MREFGKRAYDSVAYINFEHASVLKSVFESDFDIQRILTAFQRLLLKLSFNPVKLPGFDAAIPPFIEKGGEGGF